MTDPKHGEMTLHRMAPGVGILGLAGMIWFGAAFVSGSPELKTRFMQSYLWAWFFWTCLTLGLFGLTLLHHTIRPQWSLPLLRIYEGGGGPGSIFLMGLLFIPIALGMPYLYEWVNHQDSVIRNKAWFLNQQTFYVISLVCFAIWLGLSYFLRSSSVAEDESRDPTESQKRTNVSAPGIVVYFLSCTAAFTAWIMSLDAHWYSTVYGALLCIGNVLAGMAFAVIIFLAYHKKVPYSNVISKPLTRDHGNMMLCLTMLWAYLTLSQFLITWAANLREEVGYYIVRSQWGWNILGTIIMLGQFFAPFLVLCAPRTKHKPNLLILVAIGILVVRMLDSMWLVLPSLSGRKAGFSIEWHDLVVFVGVGGLWLMVFAFQLGRARIFPVHDPRIREALDAARA